MKYANISLTVLAPPVLKLSDLSMTVYEKTSFQLTCEALVPDTGHPAVWTGVNFTWYKNDTFIQKDGKIFFLYQHNLRPVPIGPHSCQLTAIISRFPSADCRGFKILNMFDRVSRPTITKPVVESTDSAVESADSTADSSEDPVKIGLWVQAFILGPLICLYDHWCLVTISLNRNCP